MIAANTTIEIGLNAVIVAVADGMPQIVQVGDGRTGDPESLPFGAFDPLHHRTFEIGLRSWVEEQTALQLGYVEQLYTFGDRGRHRSRDDSDPHVVSVGYLALARQSEGSRDVLARHHSGWRSWYDYFPWEDWRDGRPGMLDSDILPALMAWAEIPPPADAPPRALNRMERLT
ncbi:MAG: NAD regulator, partial [Roseibium sp.]